MIELYTVTTIIVGLAGFFVYTKLCTYKTKDVTVFKLFIKGGFDKEYAFATSIEKANGQNEVCGIGYLKINGKKGFELEYFDKKTL